GLRCSEPCRRPPVCRPPRPLLRHVEALTTLAPDHYSGSHRRPVPTDAPSQETAVPKSTVRKKKVYTPPAELRPQTAAAARKPSPTWIPATAVGLVAFAIIYLVVYYLTSQFFDLGSSFSFLANLSYWNLAIGFGAMIAALLLFTKWR